MVKKYTTAEFREYLVNLIDEVNEQRKIAESTHERSMEIYMVDKIKEPYISMIRDYFISQGYNVFFIKRFDMTPMRDFRRILLMRLEWW